MNRADIEALASVNTDPCVVVDAAGRILFANAAFLDTFGYDDVTMTPLVDLMPDRYVSSHLTAFETAMQTGETQCRHGVMGRVAIIDARGKPRSVHIPLLNIVTDDNGQRFAIGAIRLAPRWYWHWRPVAAVAGIIVGAIVAIFVAINSAEIESNEDLITDQLRVIRGGINDLNEDMPAIIEGAITPEDVQARLNRLVEQIDEILAGNRVIEHEVEQAISQTQDDSQGAP